MSAMDFKGFGRSGGLRGDAHGLAPFAEDLALFLAQERLPGLPLVLLGHSFGGLVALVTALGHPGAADGLILSSPALVLRGYPRSVRMLRWLLLRLAPHLSVELPNNKDLVCSDPDLVRRYWADPLCHRKVTAAYTEVFPEGFKMLLDRAAYFTCPMLVLEAGEDTVADPEAAAPFWSLVPQQLLEKHRLPGFLHEVFHDLQRSEAQNLAAEWLVRHFAIPAGNPEALSAMRE
jgi:alpha-beta hydrolase superfamily lysophospholipase